MVSYTSYTGVFYPNEDYSLYRPGGYHSVDLGDVLNDRRYRICHKWGMGMEAMIWVARDNKYVQASSAGIILGMLMACRLDQWVTVKI